MTPDEINAAISRAVEGIRAGHKLEMSQLENEIARLKARIATVEKRAVFPSDLVDRPSKLTTR